MQRQPTGENIIITNQFINMSKDISSKRIKVIEVYGAELIKFADDDGWIEKDNIPKIKDKFDLEIDTDNYDFTTKAYHDLGEWDCKKEVFRDKRLRGLEHNNGWTKIKQTLWESMNCDVTTSPDYIEGFFPLMGDNGEIHIMEKTNIGYRAKDGNLRGFFMGHMSHWREYNNNKPIY